MGKYDSLNFYFPICKMELSDLFMIAGFAGLWLWAQGLSTWTALWQSVNTGLGREVGCVGAGRSVLFFRKKHIRVWGKTFGHWVYKAHPRPDPRLVSKAEAHSIWSYRGYKSCDQVSTWAGWLGGPGFICKARPAGVNPGQIQEADSSRGWGPTACPLVTPGTHLNLAWDLVLNDFVSLDYGGSWREDWAE